MNLNHDHSSPKEDNYLNGSIDDFTDCIDFTKQYQKSCGLEESSIDEENYLVEKEEANKTENTLQRIKLVEEKPNESCDKTENLEDKSIGNVEEKLNVNKNEEKSEFENENHPMEPDVSITVGESNLDKTINDVASGIEENSSEIKLIEDNKKKLVKQKFKKNHLKLPVSKNNKKKGSLFKLKDSKFIKKKNKSFQYQGIQSNIKFKCYKCSYSDFSTITELQAHQRKCLIETSDFQSVSDPGTSFTNPSSSNLRITRKVYLCSACGSYYENWNLFLHMKEIHKRHICLFCLGMFSQPDKLAQHLQTKHNVVEQNLSSVEEFSKLYRGSCYLVCVSCEAMFSEQEDFYEHSCASSQTEDTGTCPFCGLRGAHFPTCRRAFSDRSVEPDAEKSHPGLGKKLSSKKKKVKGNKKLKEVFRIVNNEHNGEMSVIVRKQSVGENPETGNDSRSRDNYFLGNNDKAMGSPLRNSSEDLVSVKQYNEKMLQLYRPNKPPEKVISSIQSIEDSINRVVENSRVSDEDEKEVEEEEEEDDINFESHKEYPPNYENLVTSITDNPSDYQRKEEESSCKAENFEEKAQVPEIAPLNLINAGNTTLKNEEPSDSESTDSEKLTIAFDQPVEHSTGKTEADEEKQEITMDPVCEKSEDNIPTAPSDTSYISVSLKEKGADLSLKSLIKEFVKVSCWNCVYCSHAKRIAVNGKQLVLHVLAEHRFVTVPEDSSEEAKEESAASVIQKLKSELSCLENCYFNSDTFDSEDKEFWKANDRIYECFHCLFATYVHKELYSHNRKMHQKTVFLCIMCKSNFYNYSELLCHLCPGIYIAGQVINPDITYRCFLCNVDPLPSSFRLMVHLRRRHNSCDICFDQSSNQFQLSTHVWKHKLSHMCYRCGIAYRNKPDITKHLFWKHGTESVLCKKCLQKKWPHVYHFCVPPNSFICDECSVSLKSAVALKVHKRLHSGEYPYSCTKCEEKFISRKLLVKHLDKHEEENKSPEVEMTEPESEKTACNLEETKSSEGEVNDSEEAEKKVEKERKPKKRKVLTDVFDLPPVNLSESDDSDQEESEVKRKVVKPESPVEEPQILNGYLNGDLQKEEPSPTQIVDGVWNNFQNYLVAKDMPKTFRPSSPFKNMTLDKIKEIMLSDHDYYIIPNSTSQEETPTKVEPDNSTEKKAGLDHDYCNNVSKCKSKSKQKAKHREDESKSSSSDSSSDSDSSCSCGSNCSCTSGSSSSTSSNDSDSDSREKRKQKKSPRQAKILNEVEPEVPTEVDIFVHDVPNENLIRESDLETDETETDEDFYDYNPAREANRILFEKRTQLLANLNGSDVVSSPPVPAKKPQNSKKKSKLKKKRSQSRVPASKGNRKKNTNAAAVTFPPKTSITPFIPETKLDTNSRMYETPVNLPYSQLRMEESVQNSAEGDLKRPKRKRVPLKFYGFSSDDESETTQGSRKREKVVDHTPTTPATAENTTETTPTIWNPHSKNSLSWRVEKSEVSTTPKVNPIKIRTSQTARHNPVLENASSSSEIFQIKRPNFQVNGNPTGQKGEKLYCFCQCPYDEVSEMIACDAEDCVIEWFHFECVGIMVPPKGSWYCPDCRKKFAAENEFLSSPANDQIIN